MQGIWGENACIIEGAYTACKMMIGKVDGQEMTWTVYDPTSPMTKESCKGNGGILVKVYKASLLQYTTSLWCFKTLLSSV